ncbi:ATP/GTP-binding protein [Rhodococcus sp. HNM0569]|uniref:ATP/GTP-binding protein n=1 Tax=Rhodococcus sp. HNM0569 TaxID=2716340 RepID=UPI00146EC278|nr:ATP/GTP-binding protein [Rhodococcus sp. HNM0569]NLU82059.1 ATP/GTP-binding protein [Rhodococcus sp. HNM0569]
MPRRKPQQPSRPLTGALFAHERTESGPGPHGGEQYVVRNISGAQAGKVYRCPGCDHEIGRGVAHVVAWPVDFGGPDERRHWHSGCWGGRHTRGVTRRWS